MQRLQMDDTHQYEESGHRKFNGGSEFRRSQRRDDEREDNGGQMRFNSSGSGSRPHSGGQRGGRGRFNSNRLDNGWSADRSNSPSVNQSQQSLQNQRGSGGRAGGRRERCERVEIRQIPAYNIDQQQITGYFSRFGRIRRLALQPDRGTVLLEFDSVEEAFQCVSAPQAPFNNRFIRIMFYNAPMPDDCILMGPGGSINSGVINSGGGGSGLAAGELPRALTAEEKRVKQEEAERLRAELQQKMAELQRQQEAERQRLVGKLGEVSSEDRQKILQGLGSVSKTIASTAQQQQQMEKIAKLAAAKQQYLQQLEQEKASALNTAVISGDESQQQQQQHTDLLEQIRQMPGETSDDLQAQLDFLKQQVFCDYS